MSRVCRLIPNFAGDSFRCQSFQEKDNLFSKGVNYSSKVSTCSVKRLSTTSGKRAKTVNQNQEKTPLTLHVTTLHLVNSDCREGGT